MTERRIEELVEFTKRNYGIPEYISLIGSRMWGWTEKNADYDYFVIYRSPLDKLVGMKREDRSETFQKGEIDVAIHEVGKTVNMLYKNNINFVGGLFGMDRFIADKSMIYGLRELVKRSLSKQFYMPIWGLAYSNYKKYFVNNTHEKIEKKFHHIVRYLSFGINYFRTNELVFDFEKNIKNTINPTSELEFCLNPTKDISEMKRIIEKYIPILESAKNESSIQDNSSEFEGEYNQLLLKWRKVTATPLNNDMF